MPEFYIIIARKIFFPNFREARAPLPPVSYAYRDKRARRGWTAVDGSWPGQCPAVKYRARGRVAHDDPRGSTTTNVGDTSETNGIRTQRYFMLGILSNHGGLHVSNGLSDYSLQPAVSAAAF